MPFKRLTMAVDRWVVGVNVVLRSKKFCHFAEMDNVKSIKRTISFFYEIGLSFSIVIIRKNVFLL